MMAETVSRRQWWFVAAIAAMIGLQWAVPTQAASIWPPIAIAGLACIAFRKELRAYEWRNVKSVRYWETVFYAVTHGIIAQAVGIAIVTYGFGVEAPSIPLTLTPGIVFSAVVCSAILEELVYRKTIFPALFRFGGFWPAAAGSSALFALAHYNYAAWLGYFLLGMVWCRSYAKSRDFGTIVVAHIAFNAISMVVMAIRG